MYPLALRKFGLLSHPLDECACSTTLPAKGIREQRSLFSSRDERLLSHHIQGGWRRELQLVKLKLAVRCLQSRICARHSGERATRRVKRRTRGGEVGGPQVAVREMERKRRMEESGARSLPRKALSQRVRIAFDRPPMGGNGWHWSAGDWSGARPSIHVTEGQWSAGGWWRWRWQWAAAAGAIMISPCCTCSGRILGDCLEAFNARVEKVGPFAARARASESRPSHLVAFEGQS